jgi:predicted permease
MFFLEKLLPIFADTVLPVFLIAGLGYLLAWRMHVEGRSLGRLLFWAMTPALVFRSLYAMDVDMAALRQIVLVGVAVTAMGGLAGWIAGFGLSRRERAAIVLTSAVSNNGNMGIPISFFAFGQPGMVLGTLYYVVSSFLNNTIGVAVASAGETPLRSALWKAVQVPVLYAALAGFVLNQTGIELPTPVFRAVDLLASAAIPGMLTLLGIQLQVAPLLQGQTVVWRSAFVRLVASPLLTALLCLVLGVVGVERNVLILQSAMPTAVMTMVLATEFDTAPQLVATVVFFTTAASMATLSLVLWFLL